MSTTCNFFIEKLWKASHHTACLRPIYEDFVSNPNSIINKILQIMGTQYPLAYFDGLASVELGKQHTISMNPIRIKTGTTLIKPDHEWVRKLSPFDRSLTATRSALLLRQYGCPLSIKSMASNHIIMQQTDLILVGASIL